MSVPRVVDTATLLPNGEVLVAGGVPAINGHCVATAELFNPSTGLWTATGSTRRCSHGAMLLANDQVLVAGATTHPVLTLSQALNSSIQPADWQAIDSLITAREGSGRHCYRTVGSWWSWARTLPMEGSPILLAQSSLLDPKRVDFHGQLEHSRGHSLWFIARE
jgi:hypothetical protein